MVLLLMAIMVALLLLNFPMLLTMIVAPLTILLNYFPNVNPILAIQQVVAGVQPFVLLAVPMFILAADIMSAGQTAKRLLDFVQTFVGHIHGGLGITTAATCTLFGAISGSTQATVVAIGKPMRNRMLESGYRDSDTIGLIISSAIIALLIPPSISMIMYCVVTGASVGDLFIAGVLPGLLILAFFSVFIYFDARRKNIPLSNRLTFKERMVSFKKAILPLGFPVIIFAGIYSGFFSPTEASAIAVLYALILEMLIFKTIKPRDLPKIALSTGAVTASVFILVAAGSLFSWAISYARIPQIITAAILGVDPSALRILITVTFAYFIGCMFVDSIVVIIILTPIFFPLAMAAGIHPIHLGIVVTLQAAIGSISPPFGCNIFTGIAIFNRPFLEVIKGLPPYIFMLVIISVLIIAFPQISLLLVP
ncbi:TRAP transporter large permease [Acidaminobacter sp.]|uniref:TRAP transporter large permease n=1 Tax=Acidaminobacter sp. TaxID=1872102 RepID=UPI00137F1C9B|nr:TRAP transporter large permease [Acidaminobacter sp.]MDK9709905.1 TRAP transporter large permease [Acidaminobacter sp.]MZQ97456.1 TRAP transporter large permease subunit [Acidaminobacter sp.]